jgi:hypothetical protein
VKGFHSAGTSGSIEEVDRPQVFASIELDPGSYIVFAKALVSLYESPEDGNKPEDGNSVVAMLTVGDQLGDEMKFTLFPGQQTFNQYEQEHGRQTSFF